MEEFLLYLIPGIIGYRLFTLFFYHSPEEKELVQVLQHFVILTLLSSLIILIGFIAFTDYEFESTIKDYNFNLIYDLQMWEVLIVLLLSITIPFIVWGYFLKAITCIFKKGSLGSRTFIDKFKEVSFPKINGKTVNRPVVIEHKGSKISKGQLISLYGVPWEFKEILLSCKINSKNFPTDMNLNPIYEYYDFENEIKYKIYKHHSEFKMGGKSDEQRKLEKSKPTEPTESTE